MCVFFSTEKWSIKYGSYCIVATAQMKFASEARPSQYIDPFGNTETTCMPLSGHFMDIEGRVLVYQTERYQLSQLIMPHEDKGRFLVLIFTPPLSSTKLV